MKGTLALAAGLAFGLPSAAPADPEPFFDGLGSYTRKITTNSEAAQRYFNQGLAFVQGFNHGEAIRSFQEAARIDPTCAMAHWGVALACGPHINLPMVPPPAAELAWKELALAQRCAPNASLVERDLIEALGHRYANPQPDDRSALDKAYADAMRAAWQSHPDDPDVGAFFAEAMMDLRPWDQWTPDGKPQPGTAEIVATLDAVLRINLQHPFANHLYIHAVEESSHPEQANAAADRLRALQPGIAHNVHMPSHIDIRCGRWQEAIDTNLRAVEADKRYRKIVGPPRGFYFIYTAHNEHMLAYAAMMAGQRRLAIDHVRALVAGMPPDLVKEYAFAAEAYVAMPYEVLARFGLWDDILAEPDHPDFMVFTRALRHAARGIAFAAKGDTATARVEQHAYLDAVKLVPADESAAGNNLSTSVLAVATAMLEGEILIREGSVDRGLARLREAVLAEDALKYDEPPSWLLPAAHSLGASLMQAGRYAEAEQVYRSDLAQRAENGWSLFGLEESLRKQGRATEAAAVDARFRRVWANADVAIRSSCYCQPGLGFIPSPARP